MKRNHHQLESIEDLSKRMINVMKNEHDVVSINQCKKKDSSQAIHVIYRIRGVHLYLNVVIVGSGFIDFAYITRNPHH